MIILNAILNGIEYTTDFPVENKNFIFYKINNPENLQIKDNSNVLNLA